MNPTKAMDVVGKLLNPSSMVLDSTSLVVGNSVPLTIDKLNKLSAALMVIQFELIRRNAQHGTPVTSAN